MAKVTIESGQSLSDTVELWNYALVGIYMPAAWTTASITFVGSYDDDETFLPVYAADGTEFTVKAAAADRYIALHPADFLMPYLKLRSGTSGTPVAQAADRDLILVVRTVM